ncbi:MAG: hypothetical protein ACWA5W_02620, partial [Phycisphaerales bacterium]
PAKASGGIVSLVGRRLDVDDVGGRRTLEANSVLHARLMDANHTLIGPRPIIGHWQLNLRQVLAIAGASALIHPEPIPVAELVVRRSKG